jgi:ABC-type transport system involved in multi-copper enzyme maturation permease subunit
VRKPGRLRRAFIAIRRIQWRRVLGPVFFYDLVRSSRQGQIIGHRCLYAGLLAFVLFVAYSNRFPQYGIADLMQGKSLSVSERARFAESFFSNFMLLQFAVILLLTPLYTAGAIADEKERRTIELLFVTDLSSHEIVLGKLASRLGKLFLLLLTGLPVVSLLELLGGVDPNRVMAGFVASGVLMLSVGSLSILASVTSRSVLGAVFGSYVRMIALAAFCVLPCAMPLEMVFGGTRSDRLLVWSGLAVYAAGHALITFIALRTAIFDLRPYALRRLKRYRSDFDTVVRPKPAPYQTRPTPLPDRGWGPEPGYRDPIGSDVDHPKASRPAVGTEAMLWKEMYVEPNFGPVRVGSFLRWLAIGMVIFMILLLQYPAARSDFGTYVQGWMRGLGIFSGLVSFLSVAMSAANRVTRERERQTLDSIRVLPYSDAELLFAKWLASMLTIRGFLGLVLGLGIAGVVTGGINPVAVPLLVGVFVVYTAFFAALGLWLSTVYSSSLRANLFTLLSSLVLLTGPGFLSAVTGTSAVPVSLRDTGWLIILAENALSPFSTIWSFTFRTADLLDPNSAEIDFARIFAGILGLQIYIAGTALFWLLACKRFSGERGRMRKRVAAKPAS